MFDMMNYVPGFYLGLFSEEEEEYIRQRMAEKDSPPEKEGTQEVEEKPVA